ncbi:hypothetical protein Ssi02_58310 [Sinosporangium siamense]|uniref:Uncharacterized protein n=1 Tax=Sinosporangium siamense TaxID=1367973 RepID=A0A919RMJ6_9ACTN|nr:hypothetical protein Ssi02_58310 [Sinosporangium siamense]
MNAQLNQHGLQTTLGRDHQGRPHVKVCDCHGVVRRVYVHLAFRWFYWGDQPDERIPIETVDLAALAIGRAAEQGWRRGEQGELRHDIPRPRRAPRPWQAPRDTADDDHHPWDTPLLP